MNNKKIAILFSTIAILFVSVLYLLYLNFQKPALPIACTLDAKICPDGSAVGRIGPSCQFQPCPVTSAAPNPTSNQNSNWKIYKNSLYEFRYPDNLKLDENNLLPTISHSIPYKNNGGCDMSGLAPTLNNLTDFKVTFDIKPANFYPYSTSEGQVTFGNLTGKYYTNGVEGCGQIEYYFPLDNKTLVVKKTLIQALEFSSQADSIIKLPDVISPAKSKEIFSQILSTFKYTPNDSADGYKAYSNNQFGISFNYPENYSLSENSPNDNNHSYYISVMSPIDMTNRKGYELQNGELKVEFWISSKTTNQSLSSYFDEQVKQTNLDQAGIGAKVLSAKDLTIAGIPAKSLTWQGLGQGTNYYLFYKNNIITINQFPAVTTLQADFNKILSSIKFTP